MKYIKSFNESFSLDEFLKKINHRLHKKIILNNIIIQDLIYQNKGQLKKVLKLISKNLKQEDIVLHYSECEDVIDDLKSMEFEVEIYSDDEYDDKVKISWNYDLNAEN